MSIERVVIVPRNGYINRLQAWASAAILAAELDAPLEILWEPETIAPAQADDLFDVARIPATFVDESRIASLAGSPHAALPRYLTVDASKGYIVLAGHDLGEQHFMDDLLLALRSATAQTLIVIAGGKFHLPITEHFDRQRRVFYRRIPWQHDIAYAAAEAGDAHDPYVGLHIRQTDRSLSAPTRRSITHALDELRQREPVRSLFVCADTEAARQAWVTLARGQGFEPWTTSAITFDRRRVDAGREAMVDWLLLARARASVFSAASSFAQEAAVASGHPDACIPLSAGNGLQVIRQGMTWMRAGAHRLGGVTRSSN